MKQTLTHSRARTFRECQRKHHIQYELLTRPIVDAEALRFGTLMDNACSEWDRTGEDLDAALRTIVSSEPFEAAKARALMRGYHVRWAGSGLKVLASQPRFEVPLINPATGRRSKLWMVGGKLDAVVEKDGRVSVLERKTTSDDIKPGSDYWKRLQIDGQVSVYFDGAVSLGYDVENCLYDVIGKPGLKPLQVNTRRSVAETPEEYERRILEDIAEDPQGYFGREPVVRLEAELADARWDLWQIAKQIHAGARDGHAPKNPEACTRFGTCPYFDVCRNCGSLEDRTRFRVLDTPHPELST